MPVTIRTNNVPRALLAGYELTRKEQRELDYIEPDEMREAFARFFRYRGQVYDLNEFQVISQTMLLHEQNEPLAKWDAYASDSFFSGICIRYPKDDCGTDYESVVVGMYCC